MRSNVKSDSLALWKLGTMLSGLKSLKQVCFLVKGAADQEAIPGHVQDPDTAVQGAPQPPAGNYPQE